MSVPLNNHGVEFGEAPPLLSLGASLIDAEVLSGGKNKKMMVLRSAGSLSSAAV